MVYLIKHFVLLAWKNVRNSLIVDFWIHFRTAFATYLITIILFFVVISYASAFLGLTGSLMVIGNIIYATLRWGTDLMIPLNAHDILKPSYGWCFYLSLLTGTLFHFFYNYE